MAMVREEQYSVDDVAQGREISPFDDYSEEEDGRHYAEFNCPSCGYSIPAGELVMEGGTGCPGCQRLVRLHITSHDMYPEWRNIPKEAREAYR